MSDLLRPVGGVVADLLPALRSWLDDGSEPLAVRTSGSTGQPKDVLLSRDAVLASATASLRRLGGPGTWLLALPVSGVGGLQVLVRSLLGGVDPVVAGDFEDLPRALEAVRGDRRYVSLVPTQLHRLLRDGAVSVLGDFDAVLIGGAALSPDLRAEAAAAGVPVVRTYGMSETGGGCVYDGLPLDDVRVRIDDGGQVQVAGAVLFDGYLDTALTGQVLDGGWFSTADLGSLDADGRLTITGRVDDVAVSGGVNVSLPAVADAIRSIDGVEEAVVLGVDDAEWGSRVVAFVVSDRTAELPELRDAVEAAGLPRTWAPRQLVLIDDLPLLPGGKIDRLTLRGMTPAG